MLPVIEGGVMLEEVGNISTINSWPKEDRPREKLLRNGEHTLSNSELLAILLRTGTRGVSAIDLARGILEKFKTFRNMSHTDASQWQGVKGLGDAKVAQIKAAIEIGRRLGEERTKGRPKSIKCSQDIVDILMPRMRDLKKEVFKTVFLNARNEIVEVIDQHSGTVNQTQPIIREIFQKALEYFAVAIICLHNHPSGDITPSPEDKQFTHKLYDAGKIMQVTVLDHIIIGDNVFYSFSDKGLI
ncbi:UPF0758 family protein [hydrothermal vent metagenome]|uniref:UPF0758 family protein n=1 Tax=hydrothermal vent metagenome TaxID=652676 RepID=A0A3B1E3V1_9ZZZZ